MAHTDKTAPYRVKVANDRRIEVHDHVNGVCELKADTNRQRSYGHNSTSHQCYLDGDWHQPIHRCGCWSCRGSWLEDERRKERTRRRKAVRNWQREYA